MMYGIDVGLTIPDNEARTAFATLLRLGLHLGRLQRNDCYLVTAPMLDAASVVAEFKRHETLFNPNKHVLRLRAVTEPGAGELWVDAGAPSSGRRLARITNLRRVTAWTLHDRAGRPLSAAALDHAAALLLCNFAFEKVERTS